jgi:antitoxin ParD1/3/4
MSTMNIFLPDHLKDFVGEHAGQRCHSTGSEYVCELIRQDFGRKQLRDLLLAGAASAPVAPVCESYFEGLRQRVAG